MVLEFRSVETSWAFKCTFESQYLWGFPENFKYQYIRLSLTCYHPIIKMLYTYVIMISIQKWDTILESIYVNWHKGFIIDDLKQGK